MNIADLTKAYHLEINYQFELVDSIDLLKHKQSNPHNRQMIKHLEHELAQAKAVCFSIDLLRERIWKSEDAHSNALTIETL